MRVFSVLFVSPVPCDTVSRSNALGEIRKTSHRTNLPPPKPAPHANDSHLMSLLMELAFSLAASVSDWTRCRIESLVLAGLVGALMVRLLGCCCCCCWNSSRMSTDSEAGVAACDRDGLEAYCRCWARCCGCECGPAAAGGRSPTGAIDGSASSASAERSPEENLWTTDQVRRPDGSALRPVTERWGTVVFPDGVRSIGTVVFVHTIPKRYPPSCYLNSTLKRSGISIQEDSTTFGFRVYSVKKYTSIGKGLSRGSSPLLLNTFKESAIKTIKTKTKGVKINGRQIHNMKFYRRYSHSRRKQT